MKKSYTWIWNQLQIILEMPIWAWFIWTLICMLIGSGINEWAA